MGVHMLLFCVSMFQWRRRRGFWPGYVRCAATCLRSCRTDDEVDLSMQHAKLLVIFGLASCPFISASADMSNPLLGSWTVSGIPNDYSGKPYKCPVKLVFTEHRQQIIYADGSGAGDNHMNVSYVVTEGRVRVLGNTAGSLRFDFSDSNTIHFNESGCDYRRAG